MNMPVMLVATPVSVTSAFDEAKVVTGAGAVLPVPGLPHVHLFGAFVPAGCSAPNKGTVP